MIRKLKPKDFSEFYIYCLFSKDLDFYTITNKTDGLKLFRDCLIRDKKCLISESNGIINGILIFHENHIRIIANSQTIIKNMLDVFLWDCPTDLSINVHKNNPIFRIAVGDKFYFRYTNNIQDNPYYLNTGFRFIKEENDQVYLFRKYDDRFDYSKKSRFVKEDDRNDC